MNIYLSHEAHLQLGNEMLNFALFYHFSTIESSIFQ